MFDIEKSCVAGILYRFEEFCNHAESWPANIKENLGEFEKQALTAYGLSNLKDLFSDGDYLAPIQACYLANESGFSIPIWAYDHISKAFKTYFKSEGKTSIDTVLKIKAKPGRGNDPFSKRKTIFFNNSLCEEIRLLNKFIGFSLDVIFEIISNIGFEGKYLSVSQLHDIYDSYGKFAKSIAINTYDEIFTDESERFDKYFFLPTKVLNVLSEQKLYESYQKAKEQFLNQVDR